MADGQCNAAIVGAVSLGVCSHGFGGALQSAVRALEDPDLHRRAAMLRLTAPFVVDRLTAPCVFDGPINGQ